MKSRLGFSPQKVEKINELHAFSEYELDGFPPDNPSTIFDCQTLFG